jgi:hypothetical protein
VPGAAAGLARPAGRHHLAGCVDLEPPRRRAATHGARRRGRPRGLLGAGPQPPASDVPPGPAVPGSSRRRPGRLPGDPGSHRDRLGSFEGRSKFTTWAYTVAVRSLLRTRKRLVEASVQGADAFTAFLDAGMGEATRLWRRSSIGCCARRSGSAAPTGCCCACPDPSGPPTCSPTCSGCPKGGAEVLGCTREAFRQRVSRARRTLRQVIDNRCGLVDPANPCRYGRQIASSQAAGILDRDRLPLARHPRQEVRVWVEPVAKQSGRCGGHRRPVPLRPLRRPRPAVGGAAGQVPRPAGLRLSRRIGA